MSLFGNFYDYLNTGFGQLTPLDPSTPQYQEWKRQEQQKKLEEEEHSPFMSWGKFIQFILFCAVIAWAFKAVGNKSYTLRR